MNAGQETLLIMIAEQLIVLNQSLAYFISTQDNVDADVLKDINTAINSSIQALKLKMMTKGDEE